MTRNFPPGFLWGASTAAHQTEGNNVNSDFWAREGTVKGFDRSGDALDSYHRYAEDMQLLAGAGANAYRFSIEWARIEPEPGEFSRALLDHYRRMIDTAREVGLEPVVTLHHFTNPRWFADEGGWTGPTAVDRFSRYVERAAEILDDVEYICTINEPNMLALMTTLSRIARERPEDADWLSPTLESETPSRRPAPDTTIGEVIVRAHVAARAILHSSTSAKVGWTIANQALTATPGNEEVHARVQYAWEDLYLEPARDDDFVGVQSYTSQPVDEIGIVPHPPHHENTMVGMAYRPDALEMAVRHTWNVTSGTPIMVTENGIATPDDNRRIDYTREALSGLHDAIEDGIDVRGYLHWSLLDNFEWGHWEPTFGLIAVDRQTFIRSPKPSLRWLGEIAQANALPDVTDEERQNRLR